jgi:hypothetical protein
MPAPHDPNRRRALKLLADAGRDGCPERVLRANGFTVKELVQLVHAGLATATTRRISGDGEDREIAVLRITEAGRKALADRNHG